MKKNSQPSKDKKVSSKGAAKKPKKKLSKKDMKTLKGGATYLFCISRCCES